MYRKLIYVFALSLVCGLSVAQAADWDRAAYWDGRYATGWADNASSIVVRDGLAAAGYTILDADQLKTWMEGHIADGAQSVVVLCRDIEPDTVVETVDANCTLRKYLDAGGKIVVISDIPFWNVGHADGTYINPQTAGASAILGFTTDIAVWDSYNQVAITQAGLKWGLTQTWASQRPVSKANVDAILATDNAGNAAAWAKFYVPGDTYRGFVRIYDTTGHPPVQDIIYVAEYPFIFISAYAPSPANGATEWVQPLLQWKGSPDAQLFNIYMSTSPTIAATDLKGMMPAAAAIFPTGPLEPGATYYWRVDSVGADGTVHTGNVWSFTVTPLTAHSPSPADGAKWRAASTQLSWTAGQNVLTHDVYFGTDRALVAAGDASVAVAAAQEATSFDPNGLEPLTTYYWRVDEHDAAGAVQAGDVWSFSTFDPNGGAVAQYWDNMILDGAPKVVKTVGEINFDWGSGTTPGTNSPDAAIPVDKFSCRWTAELNVPVTGTYKLYEASDDGARLFLNGVQVAAGWVDRGTTEDTTADLELLAGERYQVVMEMYENGGGAAAFLRWSGPGFAKEIIPQGALMLPEMAFSPSPGNGAKNVSSSLVLSWSAGATAVQHNVYLGTDPNLVAAGDPNVSQGTVDVASFIPAAALDWETTYYWRVDEVAADGTVIPGLVWSFTVRAELVTSLDAWEAVATSSSPTYFATNVQDGVYDIGTLDGEITYEFVVRSNPNEQEASMCLIGRRGFGDTKAGLKYEQWENTGTYGATLFGVADYDFGVPTNPGIETDLVFVSSASAGTTELYVNGVLKGSVPAAITLSGLVGIGYGAGAADGSVTFDNFDGAIYGVAIYDRALSKAEIRVHSDAYFVIGASDITTPGDVVVGEPNDGDWPPAEFPANAIDNNVNTKFLDFKGELLPTGIRVTPSLGPTIVTGLTFTTANDSPGRDPISFELSGSNESIDGPWTLIAAGDIVDFAQATEWPRFTKNTTPIVFENAIAYKHYKIVFPTLRNPVTDPMMQIAEIELIGLPVITEFADDFESYVAGSSLHGQGGWKGWGNTASAGAPASSKYAFSGSNSVEITGSADFVHEFNASHRTVQFSAMQYIPSGTTGETYFILMNTYNDPGNGLDWSIQLKCNLATGIITAEAQGGNVTTQIVYDQWAEQKFVIDLVNNTCDWYYNGKLITTHQWDDNDHGTLQAIDLFANNASPIYYDDITVVSY